MYCVFAAFGCVVSQVITHNQKHDKQNQQAKEQPGTNTTLPGLHRVVSGCGSSFRHGPLLATECFGWVAHANIHQLQEGLRNEPLLAPGQIRQFLVKAFYLAVLFFDFFLVLTDFIRFSIFFSLFEVSLILHDIFLGFLYVFD